MAKATNKTAEAAKARYEAAKEEMELTRKRAEEASRIEVVETIIVSKSDRIEDNQEIFNRGLGGGYREEFRNELDLDPPSNSKGAVAKEKREE